MLPEPLQVLDVIEGLLAGSLNRLQLRHVVDVVVPAEFVLVGKLGQNNED